MDYKPKLDLPPELENYRSAINSIVKPYIRILLTDNNNPTWWQSKFGGFPYMPKSFDYPKDDNGKALYLLAQINFEEVPKIEELPDKGILQFYIAHDDMYGYDFNNNKKQHRFRVIYFHNINLQEQYLVTDFSFLDKPSKYCFPLKGYSTIKFQFDYTPINQNYYDLFNIFAYDDTSEELYDIYEEYLNEITLAGHKLLGNPDFTQNDPRYFWNMGEQEQYILLLQIDSDINNNIEIMWGDCGIGNFFIKKSDLSKLDFSNVLYHWDCG
ncbi:conserved hypothetical protein [Hyella patelloides LEGE 07179]|uniref:DUF1963 domain-containing protein n=1 Tax=Hyella patelloides LEGE 07179 TaxID=945734 RepID=A0A563VN67_9CYAN|nr:YwqG family protein [Hyella patelloides]VEP12852.1 conserved hypothetical protein [Hyella patelloides LEGE 07179]